MFGRQDNSLAQLLHRPRRTPWQEFVNGPCLFLARWLYKHASRQRLQRPPIRPLVDPVSVVCVSDTHNSQPQIPDGDIFIHAGDLTQSGSQAELEAALSWIRSLPHQHKIVVAGNHDLLLDPSCDGPAARTEASRQELDWQGIVYLQNEARTLSCSNGRTVPLSPKHGNWAFQYPRATNVWADTIPEHADILVTHGPPRGHLDLLKYGCGHLLAALWRVRPRLHVCGHIHEGYGREWLHFDGLQKAFERTAVEGGGIRNLLLVWLAFIGTLMGPSTEPQCQVVNASAVGGLRDDEKRLPFVVSI
ncbi:hypothetical protein E4U43_000370 [Claviceps pusilla]|uniref:Calcineurin-like phosphoesterase domain-containing protein n=1 Tax=Claviceps pusilla TaxID=123648 RepID=A0A9P7NC33_9HYPO|nr:hypothetical protein E4U43_000370 [Claviceps pusilla]